MPRGCCVLLAALYCRSYETRDLPLLRFQNLEPQAPTPSSSPLHACDLRLRPWAYLKGASGFRASRNWRIAPCKTSDSRNRESADLAPRAPLDWMTQIHFTLHASRGLLLLPSKTPESHFRESSDRLPPVP
jgi:hypothetical protein